MKPEELYDLLSEIVEIKEEMIVNGELENPYAVRYNELVNSLQNLSLEDWIEYHRFLLADHL